MGGVGERGYGAIKRLGPGALKHLSIGIGLGFAAAGVWRVYSQMNHLKWEQADADYAAWKKAKAAELKAYLEAEVAKAKANGEIAE